LAPGPPCGGGARAPVFFSPRPCTRGRGEKMIPIPVHVLGRRQLRRQEEPQRKWPGKRTRIAPQPKGGGPWEIRSPLGVLWGLGGSSRANAITPPPPSRARSAAE